MGCNCGGNGNDQLEHRATSAVWPSRERGSVRRSWSRCAGGRHGTDDPRAFAWCSSARPSLSDHPIARPDAPL